MFLLLQLIKAIGSEVGVLESDLRSSSDGCFQVNIQDVKSLRLTCKALSEMLASQVFLMLIVTECKPTVDKHMDKLQCLATRPCTGATTYATHELTIESLSPTYNRYEISSHTQPEALLAMKKVPFDALSSFQNVQSVSYVFHCNGRSKMATMFRRRNLGSDHSRGCLEQNKQPHVSVIHCWLPVPFH